MIGLFLSSQVSVYAGMESISLQPVSALENGKTALVVSGRGASFSATAEVAESSFSLDNLHLIYNPHRLMVTCLDKRTLRYTVYRYAAGRIGGILRFGTAAGLDAEGRLMIKTQIELSYLRRKGRFIPVYVFKNSGESGFLIRERLVEPNNPVGVIGRVLRYRGKEGDFEYFYDDGKDSGRVAVTVINYSKGEYIRFGFSKNAVRSDDAKLKRPMRTRRPGNTVGISYKEAKMTIPRNAEGVVPVRKTEMVHLAGAKGGFALKRSRVERGPPAPTFNGLSRRFTVSAWPSILLSVSKFFPLKTFIHDLKISFGLPSAVTAQGILAEALSL